MTEQLFKDEVGLYPQPYHYRRTEELMRCFLQQSKLTTADALIDDVKLFENPSKIHNSLYDKEREEIFNHYKRWLSYINLGNAGFADDPASGKQFYDLEEMKTFDLMGNAPRGTFENHFDLIGPYAADAHMWFKSLEINVVAQDFAFGTMIQRYVGNVQTGESFDMTYRITSLLKKSDGKWKFVHEHLSFPADLLTQKANFSSDMKVKDENYRFDRDK